MPGEASWKGQKLQPVPIPPSAPLLKHGCHSKRSMPLSPLPASEPWLRDLAQGERQTIKERLLKLVSKELYLLATQLGVW